MEYSAAQAAKLVGVATATITRAIDKHKLSAVKDESGAWRIDASELQRVFPCKPHESRKPLENIFTQSNEKPRNPKGTNAEIELLTEKLRLLEAERERERRQFEDQMIDLRARLDDAAAKADRDAEERRKLTAILIDQRATPSADLELSRATRKASQGGLWKRLWGRR